MDTKTFLSILQQAGKLKINTRHCDTSLGRKESVADHCWRMSLMALLLRQEEAFRDLDMDKVIRMCLIHDLGESFTGDIPTFDKSEEDAKKESSILEDWFRTFPEPLATELVSLWEEMEALKTPEAKAYKAFDKLEAILSHDESDLSTWIPLEYTLQLSYGRKEADEFPYLSEVHDLIDEWTRRKIKEG